MNQLPVQFNDNFNVLHPAIVVINAGGTIKSWKVVGDFEDDHLPCVTIKIKVDKKTYLLDDCWLNIRGVALRINAEKDKVARKKVIAQWMKVWKDADAENKRWKKEEALQSIQTSRKR
jgi:hypothetical protein